MERFELEYKVPSWATVEQVLKVKEIMEKANEDAASNVLAIRAQFPKSSLADLYDPRTMPQELVKAHNRLDSEVEKAFGRRFSSDADRVAYLFERYLEYENKKGKMASQKGIEKT